jgi:hypothetical protein
MNRYAQVIGGVVVNVIESATPPGGSWELSTTQGPGWRKQEGEWLPPVTGSVVPQRVLRGPALKVIFTQLNKTKADLLAMADALPDPQKTLMRIDIEESTHFERNNPTLLALAASLSLSTQQLDDLFIAAAAV